MERKCRSAMFTHCIDNGTGKCSNCGTFMKGNVYGEHSKRRDAVKKAINEAIAPEDVESKIQELLSCGNKNIELKTLALVLDRVLGKAVTPVVTNPDKEQSDIVDEKVEKILDGVFNRE